MGGSSLQLLLTFFLFLLCLKPTLGNYWGVGDADLGCKERERGALIKIKEDLIDDYGHLSSWSTKEGKEDCCKWRGVHCNNQTGHVTQLNLSISDVEPLKDIGLLHSLEVLDLSDNKLGGEIASTISLIDRLNSLNLRNNNLSGRIPTGTQLSTFNASAYEGNPNLCGFPLPKNCLGEETPQNPTVNRSSGNASMQDEKDGFITQGFYVSATIGFVVGFWGVCGTLLLNRSWRLSYFKFLNNIRDELYVIGVVTMARLQRHLQS